MFVAMEEVDLRIVLDGTHTHAKMPMKNPMDNLFQSFAKRMSLDRTTLRFRLSGGADLAGHETPLSLGWEPTPEDGPVIFYQIGCLRM